MAEIKGFVAPTRQLRPAEGGFTAFQTTGRRVGLDYRSIAEDYARIGAVQARTIEDQRWPFDILALTERGRSSPSGGGGGARGGGLRLAGGMGGDFRAHNAVLAGGAALGDYLGGQDGLPKSRGGMLVDVENDTTSIGKKTFAGTSDPRRLISTSGLPGSDLSRLEKQLEGTPAVLRDRDGNVIPDAYGDKIPEGMGTPPDAASNWPSTPGIVSRAFDRIGNWLSSGTPQADTGVAGPSDQGASLSFAPAQPSWPDQGVPLPYGGDADAVPLQGYRE